jgi:hypothetical protein
MEDDETAIKSMSEKSRSTFASKVLLEAYAPRELLAEVLIAINDNYGNSVPTVLVIPSPRSLLARSHKAATKNDLEPTEMSVDTVSMYMADFLRYYSETNLSGILLVEDEELLPSSAEEITWYQPVLNVAKHYSYLFKMKVLMHQMRSTLPLFLNSQLLVVIHLGLILATRCGHRVMQKKIQDSVILLSPKILTLKRSSRPSPR